MDGGASFTVDQDSPHFNGMQTLKSKTVKEKKLSHDDLLGLLCVLEAEVEAKDVIIKAMMRGRSGGSVPLSHLLSDGDYNGTNSRHSVDLDEEIWLGEPTAHLNHVVAYHQLVREQMNSLTVSLQDQHTQIVQQLEEERYKHAADTAQGDDVTYMLEKERERLSNELEFEKSKQKKTEKEKEKLIQSINEERIQQQAMLETLMQDCKRYTKSILNYASREELLISKLEECQKRNRVLLDEQERLKAKILDADRSCKEIQQRLLNQCKDCQEQHSKHDRRNSDVQGVENDQQQIESSEYTDELCMKKLDTETTGRRLNYAKKVSLKKDKETEYNDEINEAGPVGISKIPPVVKGAKNRGTVSKTKPAIAPKIPEHERRAVSITVESKVRVNGESPSLKAKKVPPPAPPRVSSITRKSQPVQEMPSGKGTAIPKATSVMSSRIARLRDSSRSGSPTSSRIEPVVIPLAVVVGYGWDYSEEEIAETNRLVDIVSEIGVMPSHTWRSLTECIQDHLYDESELWHQDKDAILSGITQFEIGHVEWTRNRMPTVSESPLNVIKHLLVSNKSRPLICVKLKDFNNGSADALSFSSLTPLNNVTEYIRLVQQYQSVLFVAKENVEARHFGTCLAQWLKSTEEMTRGGACSIVKLDKDDLEDGQTATDYLIESGVLRSANEREATNELIILLLNADFLSTEYHCSDGFDWLDKRGMDQKFHVVNGPSRVRQSFYMPVNLIVMAYATQSCFDTVDQRIYRQFKVVHLPFVTPLLIKRWLLQKAKINQLDGEAMWLSYEWVAWTSDLYSRVKCYLEDLVIQSSSQEPLLFLSAPVHNAEKMPSWAKTMWIDHLRPIVEDGVRSRIAAANSNERQLLLGVTLRTFFDRSFKPSCPRKLDFQL